MKRRKNGVPEACKDGTGKLITARQAGFLFFATVTVYKLINLPQVLVEGTGRDAWIGALLLMLWEMALAVFFVIMTIKFPGKTLEDILGKFLGKAAMRIIVALFAVFLIVRLYLSLIATDQFLTANLYDKINWIPFGIPMMLIIGYAAIKGLRAIGRAAELIGIVLILCMLAGMVAILAQADFSMLLPILHGGAGPMLKTTETLLTATAEGIVFLMLLGRVERRRIGGYMSAAAAISFFMVVAYNMSFFGFYGEAGVHLKFGQAISDMLQYMRGADSLARLDIFVVVALLILALFQLMLYAWAIGACMRIAFRMPDTQRMRLLAQIPPFIILSLFDYFTEQSIFNIYNFLRHEWKYLLIVPFEVLLPIVAVIGVIVVYRKCRVPNVYYGKLLRGRQLQRVSARKSGKEKT